MFIYICREIYVYVYKYILYYHISLGSGFWYMRSGRTYIINNMTGSFENRWSWQLKIRAPLLGGSVQGASSSKYPGPHISSPQTWQLSLSLSLSLPVYLSICLSVCLSVSLYLSACRSVCLSLRVCLSLSLSVLLALSLSLSLSIYMYIHICFTHKKCVYIYIYTLYIYTVYVYIHAPCFKRRLQPQDFQKSSANKFKPKQIY